MRVDGSEFTVAVPDGLVNQEAGGVDSEVAYFGDDAFEVSWDFGWYSNPLDYWEGPITARTLSYSGVGGRVVNAEPVAGSYDGRSVTAVHSMRVSGSANQWNGLTVMIQYRDPGLQPLAECVIASIDWL